MKKFGKILAMVMVALMMMSTISFAAALEDPAVDGDMVTVVLGGLVVDEEATILVVNEGTKLEDITSENASSTILYIDQLTAEAVEGSDTGAVTFEFDASKADVVAEGEKVGRKAVDIYCGYTNMGVADPAMTTAVLAEGGQTVPEIVYGNVDGKEGILLSDALLTLQIATGTYADPTDEQKLAANVDGKDGILLSDALLILQKATGSLVGKFPVEEIQ